MSAFMSTSIKIIAAAGLFISSCSSSNFADSAALTTKSPKTQSCVPTDTKKCDAPTVEDGTLPPAVALQNHEAVFAVRNLSCALCHSKVDSNIISDFGIGSGDITADESMRDLLTVVNIKEGTPGNPYYIATHPPEFSGKFIVPAGDVSIGKNYLEADQTLNCSIAASTMSTTMTKTSLIGALKKCVEAKFKWAADTEKFVAKEKVEINPVSSPSEVKALADQNLISAKGFAPLAAATIDGITGSASTGFKAAAAVNCEGAIVFDGPVLLQNTVINTKKGCRIYSTASIFIFDAVTVSGPAESANLQLLSPIYVGFDMPVMGQCNADWTDCLTGEGILQWRLVTYGGGRLQKFSRGTGAEVYAAVKADGTKLGINSLKGSGNKDYSRIAVSAPVVYSRSAGKFSGVIIAEQFLGKIGGLSFGFDPVFKAGENAPSLYPEIKSPIVIAQ
jgi:hypothetical protein